MYCNKRLLRGIKRKIDEEEEDEERDELSSSYSNSNSRVNESLLRDCLVNQNLNSSSSYYLQPSLNYSYARQRHITFNISMCKLNRYRQSSDPSLLRSVLICNTLKRLEKELEKEGVKINFGPSGVSFIPSFINGQSLILDPPPNVTASSNSSYIGANSSNSSETFSNSVVNNCNEKLEEGCDDNENEKFLLDLDSSSGRFTPFIRSPVDSDECLFDKDDGSDTLLGDTPSSLSLASTSPSGSCTSSSSALWNIDEPTDRLTSLNWSSVLNFDSSSPNNSLNSRTQETTRLSDESSADSGLISSSLNDSVSSENELEKLEEMYNDKEDEEREEEERSGGKEANRRANKTASHTSLHTLLPPSSTSDSSSSMSHLINHHHLHHISHYHLNSSGASSNSLYSTGPTNEEIFGDIDLSLYDFDLISPLSPPNVKLAPVSAEELMRSVSSESTNNTSSAPSVPSLPSLSNQYNPPMSYSSSSTTLSSSSSSPSSSNTCGTSMSSSASFQAHYFKSKDKLFLEDMPTTVMS